MNDQSSRKPSLIYDGDCSFCRIWIDRWKQITGDHVEYAPYQKAADRFPQIPKENFAKSVQFIEDDGKVLSGAHAVLRTLSSTPGKRWILWVYESIPGVASVCEWTYRFIAQHRDGAYTLTRFLWGAHVGPASYVLTRWIFLRLVGVIYFIAFFSLGTQVLGLIGKNGIVPIENFLQLIAHQTGVERYREFPTLVWFSSSDAFLQFLCWGGAALSLVLVVGIAPRIISVLLWIFYLSLFVAGQTFLSFQWDILLLEIGFLTIFLTPAQLLPKLSHEPQPSKMILLLFRLLLFRLMFFSGVVKLASGDPSWHDLTTLTFHYETQPLPTPIAWYVHQLPIWFHTASCALMFVIELVIPFLIVAPRRLRLIAFAIFTTFMLLIIVTGNYTFFNLSAILLCVLLLDDEMVKRALPIRLWGSDRQILQRSRFSHVVITAITAVVIILNGYQFVRLFLQREDVSEPLSTLARWCAPFCIVNHYGLFAVMTDPRPEIIIEGSADGKRWLEYGFKYKPGDVNRASQWVAPHQPRLDWQMWFAALGSYERSPWFVNLCVRLLQGSPEVLDLLEGNPFPGSPPRYIRALVYEYHFTDFPTRRTTGAVWKRELKGLYLPPISLREK